MLSFKKIIVLSLLVLLPACSTISDTNAWRTTQTLYYTYINKPETLNYNKSISITEAEALLSVNLLKVDTELTAMERKLDSLPQPPTVQDVQNFLWEFPWLSGVALLTSEAQVVSAIPEANLQDVDFTPLLTTPDKKPQRNMRSMTFTTPQGTYLTYAKPVFDGAELIGLFITYFDMRMLFSSVEMDPAIFVLAGNQPLWLGDYPLENTPLAGTDFINEASKKAKGKTSNANGTALWINRYFAQMPLIFAVMQH